MRRSPILLEVCLDDTAGLAAAVAGGADRIELCSDLSVGGLTPTEGFMRHAATCGRPVYALIRPRAGDYVFSAADAAVMLRDIAVAKAAGLAGVVVGASRSDNTLDMELVTRLVAAAAPLGVTLHRVMDLVPDPFAALDQAIALRVERVLTSGQKASVFDGLDLIRDLVARAAGRVSVMAGAGVMPANAAEIVRRTGIREIHGSFSVRVEVPEGRLTAFGFAPPGTRKRTDEGSVRAAKAALASLAEPALEARP